MKTWRIRVEFIFVILILPATEEALPITRNLQSNSLIRKYYYYPTTSTSSAWSTFSNVCRPLFLDRAVDCGCYAYRDEYVGHAEWKYLEGLCLNELNGDILSGYAHCALTTFLNHGQILFRALDNFFSAAREICMYPFDHNPSRFLTNFEDQTNMHKISARKRTSRSGLKPGSEEFRVSQQQSHSKLANFCLVLADRRSVERAEAYRSCCPGASQENNSR